MHNVNWSSKTWFTCSPFHFDSSAWLFNGSFDIFYLRPGISHISFAFICIALSRSIVSIRICSFVSSALQLFASTASAECLCPTVSGCVRFITGHVLTPSCSFVHACVLVSGMVWYAVYLLHISRIISDIYRLYGFFFSLVSFPFSWKMSFAHVYENQISIFCHRLTWSKSYIFLHSKIGHSFLSK